MILFGTSASVCERQFEWLFGCSWSGNLHEKQTGNIFLQFDYLFFDLRIVIGQTGNAVRIHRLFPDPFERFFVLFTIDGNTGLDRFKTML